MPNISSETLFHFTNFENLKGILKNGFYPKYSLETLEFQGKPSYEAAYPMVCFCDIPLSQVNEHMTHYKNYGIGMSKAWVISKKLNPVIYLKKESDLSASLLHMITNIAPFKATENKNILMAKAALILMMSHIKPFEANGYNYYNEREWRHVPYLITKNDKQDIIMPLMEKDYENPEVLKRENSKLEQFKLEFDPNDIKYIIVEKESEILEMIAFLSEVKQEYGDDTIKILTSRIITGEQIQKDF